MRVVVRLAALLTLAAIVIVPTVLRARQHVELRDTTRISIRLNWQGDAPPQPDRFVPDQNATAAAPLTIVQQPHASRVVRRVHTYDEPVLQPVLDNAPDLVRGPPVLLF